MKNSKIISLIIFLIIAVVITVLLCIKLEKNNIEDNSSITITHLQTFDSSSGQILNYSLIGDFQWQSTAYEYGSIGRIYDYWSIGNPRFGNSTNPSMLVKIQETDINKVTKEDCESAKYGLDGEFDSYYNKNITKISNSYSLPVEDKDMICFSVDENKDGIMGDKFFVINVISHIDSSEGNYAESMSFTYKVFE